MKSAFIDKQQHAKLTPISPLTIVAGGADGKEIAGAKFMGFESNYGRIKRIAAAILAYILTIVALVQIGAIHSSLSLIYKNVVNVFQFLAIAFPFPTGMVVPLQVLASQIRDIAMTSPFTLRNRPRKAPYC